jgi:MFS family permease
MSAVLYEPAFTVLVRWFGQRRALALSILTSIGGFASTVFVPLTVWLTAHGSWRSTVFTLAAILALATIPVHALLLRAGPSAFEAHGDRPLRTPSMTAAIQKNLLPSASGVDWWLAAAFSVSTLSAAAAAVHVIPDLLGRGHSLKFASFVLALMGAAQVPGRLLFAPLTRFVSERALAPAVFAAQAIGLICLASAGRSTTSAIVFALLFGAGGGVATLVRSLVVAEWFGLARFGAVSGRIAMFGQFSRAAGPIVVASVAALTSYPIVWTTLAIAASVSGIVLHLLTRTVEGLTKSRAAAIH